MTEQQRNPELDYCEGGLHTITGICKSARRNDFWILDDSGRFYQIKINLPTELKLIPEQQYPQVRQRCVVKAEQLKRYCYDGIEYYTGYSEHSYVPTSDEHETELVNSVSYAVVSG